MSSASPWTNPPRTKLPQAEKNKHQKKTEPCSVFFAVAKTTTIRYNVFINGERGSSMRRRSKHTVLLPHQAKQEKTNALSLAAPKGIAGRAAMQAIKNIDTKKVAAVAGGVVLTTGVISLAGKYRFYKGIVAGELKKQLSAVNKKLDELQKQNEELQAEIAELRAGQEKQNR